MSLREICFFFLARDAASRITSVLQARKWSCILHEVKKKKRESNQGSILRRNGEKMMKVGFGLDMPFKLADSIDFAEKHTHQSRGIVSNYLKLSTNAAAVYLDGRGLSNTVTQWDSWFFVMDITTCPLTLIVNKIVTVSQCMKNGTLCDTLWCLLWSTVNITMSHYVLDMYENTVWRGTACLTQGAVGCKVFPLHLVGFQ